MKRKLLLRRNSSSYVCRELAEQSRLRPGIGRFRRDGAPRNHTEKTAFAFLKNGLRGGGLLFFFFFFSPPGVPR